MRGGAAFGDDEIGARRAALRHHEARELSGLRHRRREPDAGEIGREAKQPRQPEREQVPALGEDQRMQLVEDHPLERTEQIRRVGGGKQQRQLFRRRQQNLRRIAALPLALGNGRVAGARFNADRQLHLGDRCFQIARNVDRERLERRDVEGVQSALALHAAAGREEFSLRLLDLLPAALRGEGNRSSTAQLDQTRQKPGERLAAASRRDQQHRAAGLRLRQQIELMGAGCPAAAGKPAHEQVRQDRWTIENGHPQEVVGVCGGVEATATTTRLSTGTPFSLRTAALAIETVIRPASARARLM